MPMGQTLVCNCKSADVPLLRNLNVRVLVLERTPHMCFTTTLAEKDQLDKAP